MLARSCVETSRAFGLAYISLHHFFYLRLRGAKRLSITNVTKVKLGSGDDTAVRVFIVLLPLQPGVDSWTCWRHVWVEFIFGPRPCYEGFSPFTKKPKLHIPIRLENSGHEEPPLGRSIIKFFLFSLLRFLL